MDASGRAIAGAAIGVLGDTPMRVLTDEFVANGQIVAPLGRRFDLGLDAFNMLDRQYEDISYYFPTRLYKRGTGVLEPAAVNDFITRPGEPRSACVRIMMRLEDVS